MGEIVYSKLFILLTHRAHSEAVVAAVVAPAIAATAEVQAVSVDVAAAAQRSRPEAAEGALAVDTGTVAAARSRQEYAVAIRAGHPIAVNTVKGGPIPSAFCS